jgi:hypothetical protein
MVKKRWESSSSAPSQVGWTKAELSWVKRAQRLFGAKHPEIRLRILDDKLLACRPGADAQELANSVLPHIPPDDDEIGCEYCREDGVLAEGVCPECGAQWFEEEETET